LPCFECGGHSLFLTRDMGTSGLFALALRIRYASNSNSLVDGDRANWSTVTRAALLFAMVTAISDHMSAYRTIKYNIYGNY